MRKLALIPTAFAVVVLLVGCAEGEEVDQSPPLISEVSASNITETSAIIAWITSEASDSLVEYGLTTSYGSTTTLDESLVTNHSVSLSGLVPGTTYHFRVKSRDASRNEATSEDKTFATLGLPNTTAPLISDVAASSIAESSATITWTTNEPATSQVEYGLTTSYGSATSLDENMVTTHTVSLGQLSEDTTYHYRVKSKDGVGKEAVSGDHTFTTAALPNEPPNQPSNIAPADGAAGVSLTPALESSDFSDPNTADIHAGSQWQVSATSGEYSNPLFDSGTDTTNLAHIGIPSGILDNATTYYWRVRHQDNHDAWSSYSSEYSFTTAIFPDENLEAAVRTTIGKSQGPIYITDVEGLSYLNAGERDIADIAGLEYCTNLRTLHLGSNLISDISPLSNLANLTELYLFDNQISDISAISNLTSLTVLYLSDNQISDITPLANITSLTLLDLYQNQIDDITPLSNLTNLSKLYVNSNQVVDIAPLEYLVNLTTLWLHDNEIIDISPLIDNEELSEGDHVYLQSNPLSAESRNILIPQLEARGVVVLYDAP